MNEEIWKKIESEELKIALFSIYEQGYLLGYKDGYGALSDTPVTGQIGFPSGLIPKLEKSDND